MTTIRRIHTYLLFLFIAVCFIRIIHGASNKHKRIKWDAIQTRQVCPDSTMCKSKWGYCGTGQEYCGDGCTGGPCWGGSASNSIITKQNSCPDSTMCKSKWGYCGTGQEYCGDGCTGGPCWGGSASNSIITEQNFACAFNTIDAGTRSSRLTGLRNSGWKPSNKEEAAVFLAHVFHESDGLKTIREYCAPGCGSHYAGSWCNIQGTPGKLYYGRGWFQLSWPCNYHGAGKALGIDLLNNPDLVEQQQDLAVKTAVWFYNANKMADPAKQGDFAATTRIINGQLECNGGSGYSSQMTRVATYRRIRHCFGLGEPRGNPIC